MLRRVIGFSGLTTSLMIDTYIWIGFIKLVDRLCVVTKIWWMELWVLTWLVTCWLMVVITHIAWCLICLLLISVLLTVSTTMTVSAASWQLHTAAIFRIAFCIVRYSYGWNRKSRLDTSSFFNTISIQPDPLWVKIKESFKILFQKRHLLIPLELDGNLNLFVAFIAAFAFASEL